MSVGGHCPVPARRWRDGHDGEVSTAGRPSRTWTDEHIDSACDLHDQGMSVQAIANELALSRSTTRRLLVRAGRIPSRSQETADKHRDDLMRLAAALKQGASFSVAAAEAGVTVDAARWLVRDARTLIPEPLPKRLQRKADALRARLDSADVRAAAEAEGIDPWWALLLLVLTGTGSTSMQSTRRADHRERVAQMAARRAEGASFEVIGQEFGLGRERARRLLLATGGWTPRKPKVPRPG